MLDFNAAYVTLVTNDSYVPAALVLCHSIRVTHTTHKILCLVSDSSISSSNLSKLAEAFDSIVHAGKFTSVNHEGLKALKRPDLADTYTKVELWNPSLFKEYKAICYLDSDILVLQNVDSIFDNCSSYFQELDSKNPKMHGLISAAPDMGWPDWFNSGVMLIHPNPSTHSQLLQLVISENNSLSTGSGGISYDGADQGLLNFHFSGWSSAPSNYRLSFTYNTTGSPFYSYLPAINSQHSHIKIIHFAGQKKPWNYSRYSDGSVVSQNDSSGFWTGMIQKWWDHHDFISNPDSFMLSNRSQDYQFGDNSFDNKKYYFSDNLNSSDNPNHQTNPSTYSSDHPTDFLWLRNSVQKVSYHTGNTSNNLHRDSDRSNVDNSNSNTFFENKQPQYNSGDHAYINHHNYSQHQRHDENFNQSHNSSQNHFHHNEYNHSNQHLGNENASNTPEHYNPSENDHGHQSFMNINNNSNIHTNHRDGSGNSNYNNKEDVQDVFWKRDFNENNWARQGSNHQNDEKKNNQNSHHFNTSHFSENSSKKNFDYPNTPYNNSSYFENSRDKGKENNSSFSQDYSLNNGSSRYSNPWKQKPKSSRSKSRSGKHTPDRIESINRFYDSQCNPAIIQNDEITGLGIAINQTTLKRPSSGPEVENSDNSATELVDLVSKLEKIDAFSDEFRKELDSLYRKWHSKIVQQLTGIDISKGDVDYSYPNKLNGFSNSQLKSKLISNTFGANSLSLKTDVEIKARTSKNIEYDISLTFKSLYDLFEDENPKNLGNRYFNKNFREPEKPDVRLVLNTKETRKSNPNLQITKSAKILPIDEDYGFPKKTSEILDYSFPPIGSDIFNFRSAPHSPKHNSSEGKESVVSPNSPANNVKKSHEDSSDLLHAGLKPINTTKIDNYVPLGSRKPNQNLNVPKKMSELTVVTDPYKQNKLYNKDSLVNDTSKYSALSTPQSSESDPSTKIDKDSDINDFMNYRVEWNMSELFSSR
ncbi:Glycogenin-1 [Smittium mucronatum]|uniref:glycogenin glucosyltransferase n=1 Tax=Smittium mucronatum TaxID=133383 RepID=A0A1R0GV28_9FUNG|nr:Glycogenin-1 [Smittium mucronatum]OLY80753.1 Glycogenin-1 [Smittium mucronatum]